MRRPAAWALQRRSARRTPEPAAVFFVHSTTYDGGQDWNGPIGDARPTPIWSGSCIPNYAGPFARAGRDQRAALSPGQPLHPPDPARRRARGPRLRLWRRPGRLRRLAGRASDRPHRSGRGGAGRRTDRPAGARAGRAGRGAAAPARRGLSDRRGRRRRQHGPDRSRLRDARPASAASSAGPRSATRTTAPAWRRLRRALVWDDAGRLVDLDGRPALCVNPVTGARRRRRRPGAAAPRRRQCDGPGMGRAARLHRPRRRHPVRPRLLRHTRTDDRVVPRDRQLGGSPKGAPLQSVLRRY